MKIILIKKNKKINYLNKYFYTTLIYKKLQLKIYKKHYSTINFFYGESVRSFLEDYRYCSKDRYKFYNEIQDIVRSDLDITTEILSDEELSSDLELDEELEFKEKDLKFEFTQIDPFLDFKILDKEDAKFKIFNDINLEEGTKSQETLVKEFFGDSSDIEGEKYEDVYMSKYFYNINETNIVSTYLINDTFLNNVLMSFKDILIDNNKINVNLNKEEEDLDEKLLNKYLFNTLTENMLFNFNILYEETKNITDEILEDKITLKVQENEEDIIFENSSFYLKFIQYKLKKIQKEFKIKNYNLPKYLYYLLCPKLDFIIEEEDLIFDYYKLNRDIDYLKIYDDLYSDLIDEDNKEEEIIDYDIENPFIIEEEENVKLNEEEVNICIDTCLDTTLNIEFIKNLLNFFKIVPQNENIRIKKLKKLKYSINTIDYYKTKVDNFELSKNFNKVIDIIKFDTNFYELIIRNIVIKKNFIFNYILSLELFYFINILFFVLIESFDINKFSLNFKENQYIFYLFMESFSEEFFHIKSFKTIPLFQKFLKYIASDEKIFLNYICKYLEYETEEYKQYLTFFKKHFIYLIKRFSAFNYKIFQKNINYGLILYNVNLKLKTYILNIDFLKYYMLDLFINPILKNLKNMTLKDYIVYDDNKDLLIFSEEKFEYDWVEMFYFNYIDALLKHKYIKQRYENEFAKAKFKIRWKISFIRCVRKFRRIFTKISNNLRRQLMFDNFMSVLDVLGISQIKKDFYIKLYENEILKPGEKEYITNQLAFYNGVKTFSQLYEDEQNKLIKLDERREKRLRKLKKDFGYDITKDMNDDMGENKSKRGRKKNILLENSEKKEQEEKIKRPRGRPRKQQ